MAGRRGHEEGVSARSLYIPQTKGSAYTAEPFLLKPFSRPLLAGAFALAGHGCFLRHLLDRHGTLLSTM